MKNLYLATSGLNVTQSGLRIDKLVEIVAELFTRPMSGFRSLGGRNALA
jgi:hypothetical protein